MPKMGDGMEEGTLLRWLKKVGDQVDAGDPIAEIETDKVALEIEAAESGYLIQTMVTRGRRCRSAPPSPQIGAEGEAADRSGSRQPKPPKAEAAPVQEAPAPVAEPVAASAPRRPSRSKQPRPHRCAPMARSCALLRWSSDWPPSTTSISPAFPAPVRAAASSRTIWRRI